MIRLVSPVYLGRARNEAARHARGESLLVSPLYLPYLPCISEEPAVSPSLYLPCIYPLSPLYLGGARGKSETLLLLLKDDNCL
jgi:hypothetical protein